MLASSSGLVQQSHAFDLNLMPYIAADMYIVYGVTGETL